MTHVICDMTHFVRGMTRAYEYRVVKTRKMPLFAGCFFGQKATIVGLFCGK